MLQNARHEAPYHGILVFRCGSLRIANTCACIRMRVSGHALVIFLLLLAHFGIELWHDILRNVSTRLLIHATADSEGTISLAKLAWQPATSDVCRAGTCRGRVGSSRRSCSSRACFEHGFGTYCIAQGQDSAARPR